MSNKKLKLVSKNHQLFCELQERGYYVQKVGQEDEIDYLIVSCAEPKQKVTGKSN